MPSSKYKSNVYKPAQPAVSSGSHVHCQMIQKTLNCTKPFVRPTQVWAIRHGALAVPHRRPPMTEAAKKFNYIPVVSFLGVGLGTNGGGAAGHRGASSVAYMRIVEEDCAA